MKFRGVEASVILILLVCSCTGSWAAPRSESNLDFDDIFKSHANIEINRIDIVGVKAFYPELVESALEIEPGELFDREKVLSTEENLQTLYKYRGYEGVKIKSRLVRKKSPNNILETVLEFAI